MAEEDVLNAGKTKEKNLPIVTELNKLVGAMGIVAGEKEELPCTKLSSLICGVLVKVMKPFDSENIIRISSF